MVVDRAVSAARDVAKVVMRRELTPPLPLRMRRQEPSPFRPAPQLLQRSHRAPAAGRWRWFRRVSCPTTDPRSDLDRHASIQTEISGSEPAKMLVGARSTTSSTAKV